MVGASKTAVVAFRNRILESSTEENEKISHDVMDALLSRSDVVDPSVMLNRATGEIEVEVLVGDIETLDQAQAIGVPAIRAALREAGVEMVEADRQSAELLPA